MQHPALRYFAAIAQNGSFREAAEALHIAQSALSRQVLRLEEDLGMPLLERHARGVTLTQAGDIFLRYARENAVQGEQLRSELDALRGLRRGVLRIVAIDTLVQEYLPPLVCQFAERYPGVKLELNVEPTDKVIEAVHELRVDLGLAFHPLIGREIKTVFRQRAPLVALMSAAHPLARETKLSLTEAFAFPIALTSVNSGSRLLFDQAARAAGLYAMPVFESNSTQLLIRFVCGTKAITFLPRLAAEEMLRTGRVSAVKLKDRIMNTSSIDVLAASSRKLSTAAEEILRMIRAGSDG
jgi:DNA-binding transcriptional LysR family regulator